MQQKETLPRCTWAKNELSIHYHDTEWGVPTHDDRELFELIILEGAQAGLSWDTILAKRENYRRAYDEFDVEKVAAYDDEKYTELLNNGGIVRNRLKIASSIQNAKNFIAVQREFGSFDKYLWGFVDNKPLINRPKTNSDIPGFTELSDIISRDLKKRGFKFVGSTIIYAYLQSTGLVNDHLVGCFCSPFYHDSPILQS